MLQLRSGKSEGVPYSLSRYTDVCATPQKWKWFRQCLQFGQMIAFDPRSSAPSMWSLAPEDTLGLVFWTKDPTNLIQHRELLRPYKVAVHITATGWHEVEKGAPGLDKAGELLIETAKAYDQVFWRFSPIPILPPLDLIWRFQRLLEYAQKAGLKEVFLSFLQENDLMPETRSLAEKQALMKQIVADAAHVGITAILCADDKDVPGAPLGICVPPADFGSHTLVETCGCARMADPFTINESCAFGCSYCYAADKRWNPKKRNTTTKLKVLNG